MRKLVIDPGEDGGLCWRPPSGDVKAVKMPPGMTARIDLIRELAAKGEVREILLEKVGMHRVGNNASSSATFARHVGTLEAASYCLDLPLEEVTPAKWQAFFGKLSKDKAERKRQIKEAAQRRFPHLKVTLYTSDALGMLLWDENRF